MMTMTTTTMTGGPGGNGAGMGGNHFFDDSMPDGYGYSDVGGDGGMMPLSSGGSYGDEGPLSPGMDGYRDDMGPLSPGTEPDEDGRYGYDVDDRPLAMADERFVNYGGAMSPGGYYDDDDDNDNDGGDPGLGAGGGPGRRTGRPGQYGSGMGRSGGPDDGGYQDSPSPSRRQGYSPQDGPGHAWGGRGRSPQGELEAPYGSPGEGEIRHGGGSYRSSPHYPPPRSPPSSPSQEGMEALPGAGAVGGRGVRDGVLSVGSYDGSDVNGNGNGNSNDRPTSPAMSLSDASSSRGSSMQMSTAMRGAQALLRKSRAKRMAM